MHLSGTTPAHEAHTSHSLEEEQSGNASKLPLTLQEFKIKIKLSPFKSI
jgi:hypothetical protein